MNTQGENTSRDVIIICSSSQSVETAREVQLEN